MAAPKSFPLPFKTIRNTLPALNMADNKFDTPKPL